MKQTFHNVALMPATVLLLCCGLLVGCGAGQKTSRRLLAGNGDPVAGKSLISSYGCGACHVVPGVRTARGLVGPPLLFYSRRTIVAGELPNTPDNLVRWIVNPPAIEPGTAMPNLGVSEDKARDMAAYLYTLQ